MNGGVVGGGGEGWSVDCLSDGVCGECVLRWRRMRSAAAKRVVGRTGDDVAARWRGWCQKPQECGKRGEPCGVAERSRTAGDGGRVGRSEGKVACGGRGA